MNYVAEPLQNKRVIESLNTAIPSSHLRYWHNEAVSASQFMMALPDSCVDELDRARKETADSNFSHLASTNGLKMCKDFVHEVVAQLDHNGPGVAIIDRFPSEKYNANENRQICALFSSLVGELMAQNHAGLTLYDVKNTNPINPQKVRKSITNHAQPFHTDGGWHSAPAKFVGLYCIRSAYKGGCSLVTSSMAAFADMECEETLSTLCTALPWDRQGEHGPEEPTVQDNPMYELSGGKFLSRHYKNYILNGFKLCNQTIPKNVERALTKMQRFLCERPAITFEMSSGQFQYLNNWTLVHARTAFSDSTTTPDDEARHVIRVWNR